MADNDWIIGLTAGLDEGKSKEQIKKDIEKLRKTLDSIEFQVKLSADQKKELKSQLDALEIGLDNVSISESALKVLVTQVNNALSKIEINGFNIAGGNSVNQAENIGQQIGNSVIAGAQQEINKGFDILESFTKSLSNIGMESTLVTKVAEEIQALDIRIESLKQTTNDKNGLSVKIGGLDNLKNAVEYTARFNTKTGELLDLIKSVSTVQEKANSNIEKTITDYTIKLENLQTKYSNVAVDYSGFNAVFDSFKAGTASVNELSLAFSCLENSVKSGTQNLKSQDKSLDPIQQAINNMRDFPATLQNIETGINSLKNKTSLAGISAEELYNTYEKLKAEMDGANGKVPVTDEWTQSYRSLMSTVVELTNKIEALKKAEASDNSEVKLAEQVKTILENIDIHGKTTTNIKLLRDNFTKLGLSADEVKSKMSDVDKEYGLLKQAIADGDNNAIVTQFNKVNASLSQTQNDLKVTSSELSKVKSELNSINRSEKLNIKISGLESNIANLQRISPEIANFKTQINGAMVSIESLYEDLSKVNTQSDFSVVSAKLTAFKNAAKSAGIATSEFSSIVKGQLKQVGDAFKQTFSIAAIGVAAISKTKEAVSELKEIDTYLTEISKANDKLTALELKEIGNNSFDVASKYGKAATHYLAGIQEASRAGYVNAEGIAELSVAAQGAGDMTAELANQYIIATDKAYKLGGSVEKLTEILDGSNYITNHNAVEMKELAEGMSIVGSQAASFGVEVNEATAALGTMIAVTKQSGSEMARALRGILLNIRQVTDEEEGIDAEGLNKYEEACKALNVSLKETKNGITSLRDPMEVLKELSIEYSKLDSNDIRRTNLLNSVGGKLRSNALNALLENYDMYSQMLEQYAQGTGSMAAEAEKTANSWEGSLNRLSNTWTDTVENVADSDAIIAAINGLNGILSTVNNITEALGSVGTIGAGIGLVSSFKNFGKMREYAPFILF